MAVSAENVSLDKASRTTAWRKGQHPQKKRRLKEKDSDRKKVQAATMKHMRCITRLKVALFRSKNKGERKTAEKSLEQAEKPVSERSLRRQKRKLSQVLPATPIKRAKVLKSPVNTLTPNSKKILATEGSYGSEVESVAQESTKEIMESLKPGTSSKVSDRGHHVYKVVKSRLAAAADKKKFGKKLVFKKLGLSRGPRKKEKPMTWNNYQRKKRSDAIAWATKTKISNFYLQDDVSRMMPNKKDVLKVKNEQGKKCPVAKRLMSLTQREAYAKFNRENPEIKIGKRTFDKNRPKQVKRVNEASRITCLCVPCQNITLKAELLMKISKTDDKISNLSKQEIIDLTVCSYGQEDHPRAECLTGTCTTCGFRKVSAKFEAIMTKSEIKWEHWEYSNIEIDNVVKRKMKLVEKKGSGADFMKELEKELNGHAYHLFRALWQQSQQKVLREKLQDGEAIIMMDFAEDYTIRYQDEVKEAHWLTEKVTIHPVYVEYSNKADHNIRQYIRHSLIVVSDEHRHDSHFVLACEKEVLSHIDKRFEKIYEFTDGAPAQYKGKCSFSDIANSLDQLEVKVERHFSETAHGKGICDGLGGVSKHCTQQAVLRRQVSLKSAKDYYTYGKSHFEKENIIHKDDKTEIVSKRSYLWLPKENIVRDRRATNMRSIQGTRKLHAARHESSEHLDLRNLSCFCDPCLKEDHTQDCENKKYVEPWKRVNCIYEKSSRKRPDVTESSSSKNDEAVAQEADKDIVEQGCSKDLTNQSAGDLCTDMYVKVQIGETPVRKTYVAQIVEVDHATEEVCLSFMEEKNQLYMWPEKPEQNWEAFSSVVKVLPNPVLSSRSTNRRNYFVFK